jgi:hypothetical protein
VAAGVDPCQPRAGGAVSLLPPATGWSDDTDHHHVLYFLGTGGPRDTESVGDPGDFEWRFTALAGPEPEPTLLAFTGMPALMAFTRAVNSAQPFAVPTEALRLTRAHLPPRVPARCLVNPTPEAALAALARGGLVERRVPELSDGRRS